MDRQTFIDTLRRALYGKISDGELMDNVRYYENYFAQEEALGRSEQEILEELGDPRLIARTLLDTAGRRSEYREYTMDDEGGFTEEKIRTHQISGWKAGLILLVGILAVVLILVLVFHVAIALLPAFLAMGLVMWIIKRYGK